MALWRRLQTGWPRGSSGPPIHEWSCGLKSYAIMCLALGALLLGGCATKNTSAALGVVPDMPSGPFEQQARVTGDYPIGPDDVLEVRVFQVPDLDREVRVDRSGHISLPLIGSVEAAGKSISGLQQTLETLYGARYLQDPQVSVVVKEAASRRVTVEGAVAQPGIFPMESRLTLVQAIALARGPTNVANERNVLVFRNVDGERLFARFDLLAIREGRYPDPEILGEDVVVVDESAGKMWLRRIVEATPLIGVWSVFR